MRIPIKFTRKTHSKISSHEEKPAPRPHIIHTTRSIAHTNRYSIHPKGQQIGIATAPGRRGHIRFNHPVQISRYAGRRGSAIATKAKVEDSQREEVDTHKSGAEEHTLNRGSFTRLPRSTLSNIQAGPPNGQQWLPIPQHGAPHRAPLSIDTGSMGIYIDPLEPFGCAILVGFILIFSGLAMWFGIICMRDCDRLRNRRRQRSRRGLYHQRGGSPEEQTSLPGTAAVTETVMETEIVRENWTTPEREARVEGEPAREREEEEALREILIHQRHLCHGDAFEKMLWL